jgi:hypothetical protein
MDDADAITAPSLPAAVDRATFQAEPDRLRVREKAYIGLFHLVCYVRNGDHVFETYWTTRRGAEAMHYSYAKRNAALAKARAARAAKLAAARATTAAE